MTRHKFAMLSASALALLAIAAPAAQAKGAKLDGQLIGDATTAGSKVEAPILLSEKSAKSLKLRSPLATLTTKSKTLLAAPNPFGDGSVQIAASTLRSGDELAGKAKVKGNRKALVPKLKGQKLEVTDRASRFSVDELTDALLAMANQLSALTLRVNDLEATFTTQLAALRAELEQLKQENAGLAGQIDSILGQIDGLIGQVEALEALVGSLQTGLGNLQTQVTTIQGQVTTLTGQLSTLQGELDALETLVGTLPTDADITDLENEIAGLQGQIDALDTTIDLICGTLVVC